MLIKSTVEGVVWPGLPDAKGVALWALMFQFGRSEFYSPEALFEHQSHQLRALFRHAAQTTPFYKDRFAAAGFDPDGDITPATIRRLPPLTRTEFQEAGDTTNSTALPPGHGKPVEIETSGTTGRKVVLYKTPLTQLFWWACALRGHLWHDRDPRHKVAFIRYLEKPKGMAPDGLKSNSWGAEARLVFRETGPSVTLNIASKLADQAEWLVRHDPEYLVTYPSNLMALLDHFERNNLTLPALRQVVAVSEVVSDRHREACRRIWGVQINDLYTCEETGYLALQCPDFDHYHVQSENVYLEVVDDNGDPCKAGERGRVLITSLHNFATPLIRYDVGDYAEPGEPCPCGRGLPVLTRIHGRARNRLVLPNGQSEFPYLGVHEEFTAITPDIRQFQFVQHSVEEVEFWIVVENPLSAETEKN